jgi:hypothetical protein
VEASRTSFVVDADVAVATVELARPDVTAVAQFAPQQ